MVSKNAKKRVFLVIFWPFFAILDKIEPNAAMSTRDPVFNIVKKGRHQGFTDETGIRKLNKKMSVFGRFLTVFEKFIEGLCTFLQSARF